MQQRLRHLGWQEIEVIDEDLGRSAAGGTQRIGFERMVAEVCLGRVGAVAAREVSRFARNSREWQQLVEVCRVVDTLLVDHENRAAFDELTLCGMPVEGTGNFFVKHSDRRIDANSIERSRVSSGTSVDLKDIDTTLKNRREGTAMTIPAVSPPGRSKDR